ncbi:MAG TPA: hypothetical protein VGE69_04575 [Pseudomonadales bacterium]
MSSQQHTDRTASGPSHITAALHGRAEERLAEPAEGTSPESSTGPRKEKELKQPAVQEMVNEVIEKGE